MSVLDNSFVQRLVLFVSSFESLLVIENHLFLFAKDLLDDLVLVFAHLIYSIVGLHLELGVLLSHGLDVFLRL